MNLVNSPAHDESLVAQLVRAPNRYLEGHGFDSRRWLRFFLCPMLVSCWIISLLKIPMFLNILIVLDIVTLQHLCYQDPFCCLLSQRTGIIIIIIIRVVITMSSSIWRQFCQPPVRENSNLICSCNPPSPSACQAGDSSGINSPIRALCLKSENPINCLIVP